MPARPTVEPPRAAAAKPTIEPPRQPGAAALADAPGPRRPDIDVPPPRPPRDEPPPGWGTKELRESEILGTKEFTLPGNDVLVPNAYARAGATPAGRFASDVVPEPAKHLVDELVDAKTVEKSARRWLTDRQDGLPALQRELDALLVQQTKVTNPAVRTALETRLAAVRDEIATGRAAAKQAIEELQGATKRLEGTRVPIRNADGTTQEVKLGAYLGGGLNGHVFAVDGDPQRVLKLFTDRGTDPAFLQDAIKGQIDGARLLANMPPGKRVPTTPIGNVQKLKVGEQEIVVLPMTRVAETPAAVEVGKGRTAWQSLPEGTQYRVDFDARNREVQLGATAVDPSTGYRILHREEQRAVLDLFQRFADEGLVWTDGHVANLYFVRTPNGLQAGILDTDRIGRLAAPGAYMDGWMTASLGGPVDAPTRRILSMFTRNAKGDLVAAQRGWQGRDPGFAMRKMLEDRGYLRYDVDAKGFDRGASLIDPEFTRQFPALDVFTNP
ncbi:MAG: hypothetical protein FJZ92_14250 [Chloroflexi bacterium]|nr:hypothetical protein [Chloroflexota bacterium]